MFLSLAMIAANAHGKGPVLPGQETETRQISGTIVEQRKYSVVVQNGSERIEIAIPDRVPINQRLDRPRLDLTTRCLTQEIVGIMPPTGSEGTVHEIVQPLPEPLGIRVEFAHQSEMRRLMEGDIKRFVRYRLVTFDRENQPQNHSLAFTARVVSMDDKGILTVELDGKRMQAELGTRDAQLGGGTIADLRPFETEIEGTADRIDEKWVAQNILFRRVIDPLTVEVKGLPRVLVLGDEVSLSYLRALREQLQQNFNVQHPAENCRGSDNWKYLPVWLGPYAIEGRGWDVIVFNYGLADIETEIPKYEASLHQTIKQLRDTNARLVWAATTPLPQAIEEFAGLPRKDATDRIDKLNNAARKVIGSYPDIAFCDLWQTVAEQQQVKLAAWANGRTTTFNYANSIVLAEAVATAIRNAARQPSTPAD
jgi:hypothetical protein